MKTPHAGGGQSGRKRKPTGRGVPLNVFIGYADLPAVRRATACVTEAARESGRHVEVQPLLWRAQQLASAHWRDRSIAAALEADIVILTCSAAGPLVPEFDSWVRHFLKAAQQHTATLVVVAGPDAWTISFEQPAKVAQSAAVKTTATPAVRQKLVA